MNERAKQVYRVTIDAPIQDVWDTLTKEGEVLPFFFGSVLHTTTLAPGAPVRMRSPDGKYTGVVGEVLELVEPTLYSHTFKFTNYDDAVCKVSYELEELDEGARTQLTLITDEVPSGTKTEGQMAQGGEFIVQTLKSVVETGRPPFKSRLILGIISLTRWMTPKRCLSTEWPLDKSIP